MTEAEWLACEDPLLMMEAVQDWAGTRKLRLLAIACCEQIAPLLTSDADRVRLDLLRRAVEGTIGAAELDVARTHRPTPSLRGAMTSAHWVAFEAVSMAYWAVRSEQDVHAYAERALRYSLLAVNRAGSGTVDEDTFCSVLRDIFGNPFRPVSVDPSWLTTDVLALARGIYDERAFDRMPILADALQDAGCANDDVLTHCRDPKQLHVRGCWVIDLLTGRG